MAEEAETPNNVQLDVESTDSDSDSSVKEAKEK